VFVAVNVIVIVGVHVEVGVGEGNWLTKSTAVATSLSGTAMEPGKTVLCGVMVFVCAVSLYMLIVA
jgi:hypothetical protein